MKLIATPTRIPVTAPLLLGLLLCLAATPRGQAAALTWTGAGGDDNWSTPANWSGTAPAPNDLLLFSGSTRPGPVNDFPAGAVFNNLSFLSSASSFTLSGNSIFLTNGLNAGNGTVSGGSITNSSASAQTIMLPITFTPGHHTILNPGGTGQLNLNGALTRSPGATVGFVRSGGNINVTGSGLATVNGILGGWAPYNSTDWATLDGGGNVIALPAGSYTTVAAGGSIANNPASNVRVTSSGTPVTLAAAGITDINSLMYGATTANMTNDVGAGNTLRLGPNGGFMNSAAALGTARIFAVGFTAGQGFITAGGADNTPGNLYFIDTPFNSGSGNNLVINPVVTDNGTGPVTVHILGYVQFNNVVNTYSGGTYINQGRVQAGNARCFGTGPVYVFNGGHIFLNQGSGNWTNDFFISGFGSPESGGIGAIRMGGNRTISGTVTLMGTAATGNGTITGRITGPGGLIVGSGTANGSGVLTVGSAAGSNDYDGDTTINNVNAGGANTLRINTGRSNVMPHGAGKGNVVLNGISATVTAAIDLNGTAQTINGLNSAGSAANTFIVNSNGAAATLTLGDADASGTFGGQLRGGNGDIAVVKIGAGTQALSGANTYAAATTVSTGKLVSTTASTGAGSFTVADGTTLGVRVASPGTSLNMSALTLGGITGCTLEIDPGSFSTPTVPVIEIAGDLTVNVPVTVNITSAEVGAYTILHHSGFRNGFGSFALGPLPPGVVATLVDDTDNNRVLLMVTAGSKSVTWDGSIDGDWDSTKQNWKTNDVMATYFDGDHTTFDDTASGTTTINLITNLAPRSITVSNIAKTYTFMGAGKLTGATGLTKKEAGTLILDHSGTNDFTGPITISAGTVQVGNGDALGNLGASSVDNSGVLAFARSDAVTVANAISGPGTLKQDSAGILTVNGANTFAGLAIVAQGTLKVGNASALGSTNGITTVQSGATLDVNAQNLALETVAISGAGVGGQGAIINSSSAQQLNALRIVRLDGDARIGGPGNFQAAGNPGRWDIRSNPTSATNSFLNTGGEAYSLTKVGSNQIAFVGTLVDPFLADIDIREGLLGFETATSSMGNPARTLTMRAGATLSFFNAVTPWNKNFVLHGDSVAPSVTNWSGANAMIGPVTLNGPVVYGIAGTSLTNRGDITGPGSLIKQGNSPLVLEGTHSYAGATTVSNGTLFVDGRIDGLGNVMVQGGTLAGVGVVSGPITVAPGGTLAPGNPVNSLAAFTVFFTTLNLVGTNLMDLNKTAGGTSSDGLVGIDGLTLGGTLRLNITGEALAAGDAFELFNFTAASGAFTSIIPATPGPGLVWDVSQLAVDGFLRVALPPQPGIASSSISGSDLILSGTNGIPGGSYRVLCSTNVALPVRNWTPLVTNLFDGSGNFSVTNAVDPNSPQRFYLIQLQ